MALEDACFTFILIQLFIFLEKQGHFVLCDKKNAQKELFDI